MLSSASGTSGGYCVGSRQLFWLDEGQVSKDSVVPFAKCMYHLILNEPMSRLALIYTSSQEGSSGVGMPLMESCFLAPREWQGC